MNSPIKYLRHVFYADFGAMNIQVLCVVLSFAFVQGTEKCCPELGCFDLGPPWTTLTRILPPPRCQDEVPVYFYLYTRVNPRRMYKIQVWPEISLRGSNYNGKKITMFHFHGWQSSPDNKVKDAYLKRVDANVILVDWTAGSSNRFYPQSASDTRMVSAQAARLAGYLIDTLGASPSRMHIMGISLGAQTAGYTARLIPGVARLSGYDPAGPLFQNGDTQVHLNTADAQFVEVLHTNGHPFASLGSYNPLGHVDFYFNGGLIQPGCGGNGQDKNMDVLLTRNMSINDIANTVLCSHSRSIIYYIEAVYNQNCMFWGTRRQRSSSRSIKRDGSNGDLSDCNLESCIPVGLKTIQYPARGSFDVITYQSSPFCISHRQTDEKMAKLLAEYQVRIFPETTNKKTSSDDSLKYPSN